MHKRLRCVVALAVFSALLVFIPFQAQTTEVNDAELRQALASHTSHLKLKAADWTALAKQEVVTRELPISHGKEMAGFGTLIIETTPEEIATAFRTLAAFKQSANTLACGRFGQPPSLTDLANLKIRDRDTLDLMRAKTNEADIKLSAFDIARLQAVAGPNTAFSQRTINNLVAEYKHLLFSKVQAYRQQGSAGLGEHADQEESVNAGESLRRMLGYQQSQALAADAQNSARLYALLAEYPRKVTNEADSFIYWAVQKFGQLKPVTNLVHVFIHREGANTFIASQQIYSSHYTEAGLSVAELIPFTDAQGKPHTLVAYTLRLQVDLLGGTTGFMKRRMAQPRMLETLKESLLGLRRYVETAHSVPAQ